MLRFAPWLIVSLMALLGLNMTILGAQSVNSQDEFHLYFPIVFRIEITIVQPTRTPTPTQTRTPTRTRAPYHSPIPQPSLTHTPTYTLTPTVTNTPTSTSTTTLIPLPSIAIRFPSHTPSLTPSRTMVPSSTPSPTQSPGLISGLSPTIWILVILVASMWVILAVALILFLRRQK